MIGYIGTRSKQRSRRRLYYVIFAILAFLFIYFSYIDDESKRLTTNVNVINNADIELEKNTISLKKYEIKISEKDNQINSLMKKNKLLSESIDLLNFNLEKNLEDFKEISNKEIEETNTKNQELQKELQNLNSSILKLKDDSKTISDEYLKINSELKKSEEKALHLEKLLSEKNKLIEELRDKIHH